MLSNDKVTVITREDLFSLATEIYFNAKYYLRTAKHCESVNDYFGYTEAKRSFEEMRSLMQNPVFSEWDYTEELEHADMPMFTINDYINRGINNTVVFSDGSAVDECDVPF